MSKQWPFMSKTEGLVIKNNLKLRFDPDACVWEVWAQAIGTSPSKWIVIDQDAKDWYVNNFNPPIVPYEKESVI